MSNRFVKAKTAFITTFTMLSHIRLRRLFIEDPNVKAPCWFSRQSTDFFHVPAQVLRVFVQVIFAPIYLLIPRGFYGHVSNYGNSPWALEMKTTPDSVLSATRDREVGGYAPTGSNPRWMLKVRIVDGAITSWQQVCWSEEVRNHGYTALSYPMESAYVLFQEAGFKAEEVPLTENRLFTLRDRKRIAERLLIEYCVATRGAGDGTEYIWLDEFCLSDADAPDGSSDRTEELGRLAEIFRNASQVAVFCHEEDCDHTSTICKWGARLFTIGEILHAQKVVRLTRQQRQDGSHSLKTHAYRESSIAFREKMQANAAHENRWHLYAIMQHSANAGSVPWQNAIHALVVEAITRDGAGGSEKHNLLGKALNGLLPRRARLRDLEGKDGWKDLAWLLELNQGFYNAASLAAVCTLREGDWLGPPIRPVAGNERLEPIVHAFPVGVSDDGITTPLCIIGSKTINLLDSLERDPFGLYNSKDMHWVRLLSMFLLFAAKMTGLILGAKNSSVTIGVGHVWAGCSLFVILEMAVGTIYLKRDGWIFLTADRWDRDPQRLLGEQDPGLAELTEWGDRQLIPHWGQPEEKHQPNNGSLVDLQNQLWTKVIVADRPNALVVLAIHGSGVTSMLLNRKDDLDGVVLEKVGMCNIPPYVLATTAQSGMLCIGFPLEDQYEEDDSDSDSDSDSDGGTLVDWILGEAISFVMSLLS